MGLFITILIKISNVCLQYKNEITFLDQLFNEWITYRYLYNVNINKYIVIFVRYMIYLNFKLTITNLFRFGIYPISAYILSQISIII